MEKQQTSAPKTAPEPAPQLTGLSKRQQIAKANKAIFLWVAGAAVVVSLSIVGLQFIVRQGLFNNEIIGSLSETNKTVLQNKENALELKQKIDALQADDNLADSRANANDNNLKVILDALPTTGDTTTISNSLYSQILRKSGVKIITLAVGSGSEDPLAPTAPVETEITDGVAQQSPLPSPVSFNATVNGTLGQIKNMLTDIERVIRPFSITLLDVKAGAKGTLDVTLSGSTYYLDASTVQLGTETKEP